MGAAGERREEAKPSAIYSSPSWSINNISEFEFVPYQAKELEFCTVTLVGQRRSAPGRQGPESSGSELQAHLFPLRTRGQASELNWCWGGARNPVRGILGDLGKVNMLGALPRGTCLFL